MTYARCIRDHFSRYYLNPQLSPYPPVRVSSKGLMVVIPFSLKFSSTDDHGKYIEGLISYYFSSYVWALQERHVLPKGCSCF